MSWPASQETLALRLAEVNTRALRLRAELQSVVTASQAGSVGRERLIGVWRTLAYTLSRWQTIAATPGIEQYARDQYNDPTLDLAAEFSAMISAAQGLRSWLDTNFPRDSGSGAILVFTIDEDANLTDLGFTSGQLATFRTQAQSVIDAIG